MRKNTILFLACLLLLSLLLAGCGAQQAGPAPAAPDATAEPTPAPTPEPTPEPEIFTEVELKNDNLPDGLQLTEYSSATNNNIRSQVYIDTQVCPTNDTGFYFDFECVTGFQTKDSWFFGCFYGDMNMYMEVGYHQAQGNEAHFYTATKIQYSQSTDPAARTVATYRPNTWHFWEPVPQHLLIFSRQHKTMELAGTYDMPGVYTVRVYRCRIWQGGESIRDYVPCFSVETGRAGMYDLERQRMSYTDGKEEIDRGPELLPPSTLTAVNGQIPGPVEVPTLDGFLFRGYYTGYQGSGERIIDENGRPCAPVGTEEGVRLYAFWERDESFFDGYDLFDGER